VAVVTYCDVEGVDFADLLIRPLSRAAGCAMEGLRRSRRR
jgi:hypothetical protein